ncbi:MAG TPA: DUF1361 domain-containing protein [Thermoanaerobaculia bacterium]|nr:DUF1361 domain-containing protein [Thermoanaerobaculia bacterium]
MKRILTFAALLIWCATLVTLRIERTRSASFFFLFWNLFLAAIPFVAAEVFARSKWHLLRWPAFTVWLLFLPNAPYIVTDFVHLRARPPIPLWYDVLLLISCAGTGLLLGYGSVMLVQRSIARQWSARAGWAVAAFSLVLSAFGIYLGRFVRFNSWEVVTDPMPLFADIVQRLTNPFAYPRTFAVTILYGVALLLGYLGLHVLAEEKA